MKEGLKRISLQFAGWGFILLGILGLFLPVLQGILFLLVGLYLLSNTSPWAAKLLVRLRERFPRINRKFEEAKAKAKEVQMNMFRKKERQPEE
ncbi:MAG TPA: PGPGW domain-containing protein [Blastocatellia bacterium]|nr:PGPGW domain-containing protein [Blastocatellia bacterium]